MRVCHDTARVIPEPQSNQRGIEIGILESYRLLWIEGLNRTSVGLKS